MGRVIIHNMLSLYIEMCEFKAKINKEGYILL